ncbi:alkane hydroxylase MAH1 [Manihot esculenta]|uniref:Cytochrome P450 n=1 Tax=Manihot esculenta TaxID=3983 RepID=A0A2C9UR40_MANES|nr:alkane hydroxylase MAH1 [Manihot esculenta]OAY33246.1 hypothetical protein MANES_13G080000v8 [Manihot esculenta]
MALIGFFEIILAIISYSIGFWLSNRYELVMNWPVLGMLPGLLSNVHRFHDWAKDVMERCGGTYHFKGPWFSGMEMIGTVDPANVKHIMSTNFSNYPKGPEYKEIFDVFGDGIFNSDFDLWKHQRKTAVALINHDKFRGYLLKTVSEKVEKGLIPILENICKHGQTVDMQDLIHRFTLDVTFILITGYDPESLSIEFTEDEVAIALDYAEEVIFYRHVLPKIFWKSQRWLGFGKERKMRKAWETLDRVAAMYIERKREQLKQESIKSEDLLTSYITNKEEILISKTENEFLRDTVLNFLIAGRENSLAWFLWLISKNPRVEAKIREELKSTIAPETEAESGKLQLFDLEKVNKLFYLHGAFCETLRLYPPVAYEHKAPLQPDILPSGHKVDSKMKILLSTYVMGRMRSIWGDDCLEFKPERWISERGRIIQQSPYKFLAFNAGPRTCLGKEIAFTEMKAIAAVVIHNYKIEVVEEHPVAPNSTSIILHMKHGMKVRISRRLA